jgi:hypothetical protein
MKKMNAKRQHHFGKKIDAKTVYQARTAILNSIEENDSKVSNLDNNAEENQNVATF